mmetsp:Transcript_32075/g.107994  ORF Transcript_32075/g.107994 Transcript_32075/m.107994 type:complete len:232 (+) Transcript_32075:1893-2588(+)
MTTTLLFDDSRPSMQASIWFSVCSTSSLEPPRRMERCLPRASSSSTKMMQGAACSASLNRERIRAAPRPTKSSTKSDPEQKKKGTFAWAAMARAISVLPVPGGPTIKTPAGSRAPAAAYFPGFLSIETISWTSCFAMSTPATSSKVVASASACLFARCATDPVAPFICFFITWLMPSSHKIGKSKGRAEAIPPVAGAPKRTPLSKSKATSSGAARTGRVKPARPSKRKERR